MGRVVGAAFKACTGMVVMVVTFIEGHTFKGVDRDSRSIAEETCQGAIMGASCVDVCFEVVCLRLAQTEIRDWGA